MKMKLVNDARKYIPPECEYLAWIDFGIFHMINDITKAQTKLQSIASYNKFPKDKIIAPSPINNCNLNQYNNFNRNGFRIDFKLISFLNLTIVISALS